jgi:hypothetical protein
MTKRKVGKPPKNDPNDVAAIEEKIAAFFDELTDEDGGYSSPPTFSGLAYALGYTERRTLWDHVVSGEPISTPIKRAMLKIESFAEKQCYGKNPAGPIFILKNRGWTDKQEIEHSGSVTIIDDVK